MRTSLNRVKEIDDWYLKTGSNEEQFFMEAKFLIYPSLDKEKYWQVKTCKVIEKYGKDLLVNEILMVENELFESSQYIKFQNQIKSIFNK